MSAFDIDTQSVGTSDGPPAKRKRSTKACEWVFFVQFKRPPRLTDVFHRGVWHPNRALYNLVPPMFPAAHIATLLVNL